MLITWRPIKKCCGEELEDLVHKYEAMNLPFAARKLADEMQTKFEI